MAEAVNPAPSKECCHLLDKALQYAETARSKVAGLQIAHVFNSVTGTHAWSPIVYILPSRKIRGQAKGQTAIEGFTAMVTHCPFCGTKQKGRPKGG